MLLLLPWKFFSDLSDDDKGEENSIMENKIENPALNEQTESVSKKNSRSAVIFRKIILTS